MTDLFLTRLCYPKSASRKAITQLAAHQILRHLEATPDGLSLNHLLGLIQGSTPEVLQEGLALLETQKIICVGSDGWFYLLNPTSMEKVMHEENTRETPLSLPEKRLSTPERLMAWLNQCPEDAEPITLTELAQQLSAHPNTLGKAMATVNARLATDARLTRDAFQEAQNWEKIERLKRLIIKRVNPPPRPKPIPIPEDLANTEDWMQELRQKIVQKEVPAGWGGWIETLQGLDRLLDELGVDAEHRSRKHLREVSQWMNQLD